MELETPVELPSHADQVPVAEETELELALVLETLLLDIPELHGAQVSLELELDVLLGSQADHVPVADPLELDEVDLGSHGAHVPLELAETLEEDFGSHGAQVPLELAEALEEVDLLGSHADQVPVAEE